MTTTASSLYSSMHNQQQQQQQHHHQNDDDQLFLDTEIQRYDADTIKHRFGDNWKTFASNVREIKQPDGSIVKEYIIEDPSLLEEIKPQPPPNDTTSSTTGSDDEQQQRQQSGKHKFAQIKAKFERKTLPNVMASPSSSSATSSSTVAAPRQVQNNKIDDLYARHRASNDSMNTPRTNPDRLTNGEGDKPKTNAPYRRLDSADDAADEEVQRIHRQGEERRLQQHDSSPAGPSNPQQSSGNIQYEIVDEDGNPMLVDDVHDLIKMSGVHAKEIRQPDGTIVKEYVIDDPALLSKIHSQHPQSSSVAPTTLSSSYSHSDSGNVPPPPPRIPLRQPMYYRQGLSTNDNNLFLPPQSVNIQQIRALEPQRRYEFTTASGRRIEFVITNAGSDGTMISDADIRELSHNINTRLIPSEQQQRAAPPFTLPKQWYPAVDLTHRAPPPPPHPQVIPQQQQNRQRIGSDTQAFSTNYQIGYQQGPPGQGDLVRSSSYGVLNQGPYLSRPYPSNNLQQQQFTPMVAEPIIDWSALRQQDPHGQIDPAIVQQIMAQQQQQQQQRQHHSPPLQRHQDNVGIQSSAQFLPQQPGRSTNSPPSANAPVFIQQQAASYPYQGQQQHGVRIISSNDFELMQQQQQRAAMLANGHARI